MSEFLPFPWIGYLRQKSEFEGANKSENMKSANHFWVYKAVGGFEGLQAKFEAAATVVLGRGQGAPSSSATSAMQIQ